MLEDAVKKISPLITNSTAIYSSVWVITSEANSRVFSFPGDNPQDKVA